MKKYALIGFGTASSKVVNGFNDNNIDKIAIDSDGENLNFIKNTKTIKVNIKKDNENCKLSKKDKDKILNLLNKYDKILFYICLGGITSAVLINEFVEYFNDNHFFVIPLPCRFEGKTRNTRAQNVLDYLKKYAKNILCINEQQIFDNYTRQWHDKHISHTNTICNRLKNIKQEPNKEII